jgi:hypothetical protein
MVIRLWVSFFEPQQLFIDFCFIGNRIGKAQEFAFSFLELNTFNGFF